MLNPDPFSRRRHHNGNMLQSGNGASHKNFELVYSSPNATGFKHMSLDGDSLQWSVVGNVGSDAVAAKCVGQPLIMSTSFNRDFEVLCRDDSNGLQQWTYSQAAANWAPSASRQTNFLEGYPGFVQADDSNFTLVIRHQDGTLNEVIIMTRMSQTVPKVECYSN